MLKTIKTFFARLNEESTMKSTLQTTTDIYGDTIYSLDFAKDKLLNDHISKYKWRTNPFNEDDNNEKTMKNILELVQIYYMRITLEKKNYMEILYKKYLNKIYTDEFNDTRYDIYYNEIYDFAKRKYAELCKDYEMSIDVYYKKFASKHAWLSQVLFEYEDVDIKIDQLAECIHRSIIDYKAYIEHRN